MPHDLRPWLRLHFKAPVRIEYVKALLMEKLLHVIVVCDEIARHIRPHAPRDHPQMLAEVYVGLLLLAEHLEARSGQLLAGA